MKLSLVLLTCLVGLVYPQGYGLWPAQYNPRSYFYPSFYGGYNPYGYNAYQQNAVYPENGDIQARTRQNQQDARLFFGNLYSYTSASLKVFSTITSTVYSYVTSTGLSATTVNCIGNALLAATNAATNCRRKRDSGILAELLAFENDSPIPGSFYAKSDILVSAVPDLREKREAVPAIESSRDDETETIINEDFVYREGRARPTYVTTVTSTATTYSFSSSTITKTLTVSNFAAAKKVSCVPSGYVVC